VAFCLRWEGTPNMTTTETTTAKRRDRIVIRDRKSGKYLSDYKSRYMTRVDWEDEESATVFKSVDKAHKRALKYMREQNYAAREVEVIRSIVAEEIITTVRTTTEMEPTVLAFYDESYTPE
jgi:hypothetical protein